jgi:hypothetical protein
MSEAVNAPSLGEVLDWAGAELVEREGGAIGHVHGFYVDVPAGHPVWVVAQLGKRRAARTVTLPLAACAGSLSGVWSAFEAELVRHAPLVDPRRPLRREHELAICAHYGIGEDVGRAAQVAGRAEGEITAEPAHG